MQKRKNAGTSVKTLNKLERKLSEREFKKIFKSITVDNGQELSDVNGMEQYPCYKKFNIFFADCNQSVFFVMLVFCYNRDA